MENIADPREPGGVCEVQRVVHHIAVAVEILRILGDLDDGVRAEHAAELGVVDAAVHVDEAAVVELFVAGVAAVVVLGAGAVGIAIGGAVGDEGVGGAALAPGIEGLALALRIGESVAVPSAC